jgi:hypothetical protein
VIASAGGPVKILGMCQSGCTMATVHIPKDRLCFGERGYLNFHQARYADGRPAVKSTEWMIKNYPADIRDWLIAKGGLEKMPLEGYWKLPASELWKMGYRKCA